MPAGHPPARLTVPERLTAAEHNEQLLYFTSTSLTADGTHLYVISDRTGAESYNIVTYELNSGRSTVLTDSDGGFLHSYVYFAGAHGRGFGRASPSLHAPSGALYYIEGFDIRVARPGDQPRTLARLPPGQVTAFTHVSEDGRQLCVPTTDARALSGPLLSDGTRPAYDVDARVQAEGLSSYLRIYATADGRELAVEPVPTAWVTHVSFNPTDPDLLLYNHEWPSDCGVRRIWLWDRRSGAHVQVRTEADGRSRADWTCHEFWAPDGRSVLYHGQYGGHRSGQPAYLGRYSLDASGPTEGNHTEIPLPSGWERYGHFTVGPDGRIVTDGYYEEPEDPAGRYGAWISVVTPDWNAGTLQWQPLCRHGSSWSGQDEHPHPVFGQAGMYAYFTSDRDGTRAVYRVPVPPRL